MCGLQLLDNVIYVCRFSYYYTFIGAINFHILNWNFLTEIHNNAPFMSIVQIICKIGKALSRLSIMRYNHQDYIFNFLIK